MKLAKRISRIGNDDTKSNNQGCRRTDSDLKDACKIDAGINFNDFFMSSGLRRIILTLDSMMTSLTNLFNTSDFFNRVKIIPIE